MGTTAAGGKDHLSVAKCNRSQSLAITGPEGRRFKTVTYRMSLPNPDPPLSLVIRSQHCGTDVAGSGRSMSEAGLGGSSGLPYPGYPYALMLRLRVVQIVCGILTALVGSAACIEKQSRSTLSVGLLCGFLTLIAAVVSISLFRKELCRAARMPLSTWILTDGDNKTLKADFILAILWLSSVVACVLMIGLSALSLTAQNKNIFVLGVLETTLGVIILISIVGTVLLRVRYGIIS